MKKLMVIAAVAFAAVAAQAGQVRWSSTEFNGVGEGGVFSSELIADGAATGTLMMLTATAWNSYMDIYDTKGYAEMAAAIYNDYTAGTLSVSATGTSDAGKIVLGDGVNYSNGTSVYAALVYETKVGGVDYYIANLGDYTAKSAAKTVLDFATYELGAGTSGTENAITGWTAAAIPEPTSGLLLLLGMAGLALKRKVA